MKHNIHLYIKAGTDFRKENRPGYYIAVMVDLHSGYLIKEEDSFDSPTTPNRLMITAAIEMIKKLKRPCHVTIFTTTAIGLVKRKGINKDLLMQLIQISQEGKHQLDNSYNDPEIAKYIATYGYTQNEIRTRLRNIGHLSLQT